MSLLVVALVYACMENIHRQGYVYVTNVLI